MINVTLQGHKNDILEVLRYLSEKTQLNITTEILVEKKEEALTSVEMLDILRNDPDLAKLTPSNAFRYAIVVVKGRWPEGESTILKNPYITYLYAKDVIKGKWTVGESVIVKDPFASYMYAKEVIGGRWPEGEESIFLDPQYKLDYESFLEEISFSN